MVCGCLHSQAPYVQICFHLFESNLEETMSDKVSQMRLDSKHLHVHGMQWQQVIKWLNNIMKPAKTV